MPASIINNGTNIVWCIVGAEVNVMLEGWCNVFHQSTEYFITGKFNNPTIPMIDDILFAFSKFLINFHVKT